MTEEHITGIREALLDPTIACFPDFTKAVSDLADEFVRLKEENERMREALKPFGAFCERAEGFVQARSEQGGSPIMPTKYFTLADFRRARAALKGEAQ